MTPDTLRDEFKEKFCWQDTDGTWLLNASPLTVPDLIDFWLSKIASLKAEIVKEAEGISPSIGIQAAQSMSREAVEYCNGFEEKYYQFTHTS